MATLDRYKVVNLLSPEACERLTTRLHRKHSEGATHRDPQCPLSDSLRDDPTLDSVLEQLVPLMEDETGLRLSPTYCYARIYRPGDVLEKHTDRPACEISVTVTLGYSGGLWPIFMDGEKFMLETGDGAIYRGCEVEHWRERYCEGNWQTQAFFHYVDALGPHRDWRYDRRSKLAHH